MRLMQTDGKSDNQSHKAGKHNHSYDTDAPPAASPRNVCIVPQILKLLSFRTLYIP